MDQCALGLLDPEQRMDPGCGSLTTLDAVDTGGCLYTSLYLNTSYSALSDIVSEHSERSG